MTFKPWMAALAGGVVVGGGVLAVLMIAQKNKIEGQGEVLRRQLTSSLQFGTYAAQMTQLKAELGTYAETVANRAADEHLSGTYGLTRDRMTRMGALATRLGVG